LYFTSFYSLSLDSSAIQIHFVIDWLTDTERHHGDGPIIM